MKAKKHIASILICVFPYLSFIKMWSFIFLTRATLDFMNIYAKGVFRNIGKIAKQVEVFR